MGLRGVKPWEGPTDEQWAEILATASGEGYGVQFYVKTRLKIAYDTFLAWRRRNPEKEEEFQLALQARAERYMFELEPIADNVDKDGNEKDDNQIVQGRAKIRIDYRLNYLKAFNNHFKPKQDINVTGLSDDDLKRQLESEIKALIGRGQETGDQP